MKASMKVLAGFLTGFAVGTLVWLVLVVLPLDARLTALESRLADPTNPWRVSGPHVTSSHGPVPGGEAGR